MSEFRVSTSQGHYDVRIQTGAAGEAWSHARAIIVDSELEGWVAGSAGVVPVPGSESTKTLGGCEEILVRLADLGVRRGDQLVAVGGGTIQDAATFVASFYMRGIPWTYVPTTAMAMLDSCVGGKSSINVAGIKNLGGNIYPPKGVVIDPSLAETLSLTAKASGMAEAVKICFVRGPESFSDFLALAGDGARFGSGSEELIRHVLLAKKWFIEIDEFDKKERQLLNFGHTFGHALETAVSFRLQHGIAVALGVMAAVRHPRAAVTPLAMSLHDYCSGLLEPLANEVSLATKDVDWEAFRRAVERDKKGTPDSLRVVLPDAEGGVSIVALPRSSVELDAMCEAMQVALHEVVGHP